MDEVQQDNQKIQDENVSLDQLQQDLDNAMNGWKRAQADFENYKKRKEAENKELIEFAREGTVAKLLPALDSLEQALKHMPEFGSLEDRLQGSGFAKQYQNWQTGIAGILLQWDKT